jgi:hypothetical protein
LEPHHTFHRNVRSHFHALCSLYPLLLILLYFVSIAVNTFCVTDCQYRLALPKPTPPIYFQTPPMLYTYHNFISSRSVFALKYHMASKYKVDRFHKALTDLMYIIQKSPKRLRMYLNTRSGESFSLMVCYGSCSATQISSPNTYVRTYVYVCSLLECGWLICK